MKRPAKSGHRHKLTVRDNENARITPFQRATVRGYGRHISKPHAYMVYAIPNKIWRIFNHDTYMGATV